MSKKEKPHIFDKKLQPFEQRLINYIEYAGRGKYHSDIESHIVAYLILHETLTQKQIKELSNLYYKKGARRGFSYGSISKALNEFKDLRAFIEKHVMESKYGFEYSLDRPIVEYVTGGEDNIGINILHEAIDFFKLELKALQELKSKRGKGSKLLNVLLERTEEMIEYLNHHNEVIKDLIKTDYALEEKPAELGDYNNEIEIENEILEFISASRIFLLEEEKYIPILDYLITRKELAQKEVKQLTGLSSGLISQGLNFLLEKNFIQSYKKEGDRQFYYQMGSIGYFNFSKFHERLSRVESGHKEILEIQQELEERKEELAPLNGYSEIMKLLKLFIELRPLYQHFIEIIGNAAKKYEKYLINS